MLFFGVVFVLYFLKLSDGRGFWLIIIALFLIRNKDFLIFFITVCLSQLITWLIPWKKRTHSITCNSINGTTYTPCKTSRLNWRFTTTHATYTPSKNLRLNWKFTTTYSPCKTLRLNWRFTTTSSSDRLNSISFITT